MKAIINSKIKNVEITSVEFGYNIIVYLKNAFGNSESISIKNTLEEEYPSEDTMYEIMCEIEREKFISEDVLKKIIDGWK